MLIEVFSVAEMVWPLLIESGEGETLEMKKERRPQRKFRSSYGKDLPTGKPAGLCVQQRIPMR